MSPSEKSRKIHTIQWRAETLKRQQCTITKNETKLREYKKNLWSKWTWTGLRRLWSTPWQHTLYYHGNTTSPKHHMYMERYHGNTAIVHVLHKLLNKASSWLATYSIMSWLTYTHCTSQSSCSILGVLAVVVSPPVLAICLCWKACKKVSVALWNTSWWHTTCKVHLLSLWVKISLNQDPSRINKHDTVKNKDILISSIMRMQLRVDAWMWLTCERIP